MKPRKMLRFDAPRTEEKGPSDLVTGGILRAIVGDLRTGGRN